MEHAKIALHSWRELKVDVNVSRYNALKLKDFCQLVNVNRVKPTLELSMMVKLVLQCSAPRDKRFWLMELVKIAQTIPEQQVIVKVANHKFALPDKSSKSMEDVPNAIHTQEPMLQERSVFHTTVMIDKNLAQMDHV